MSVLFTIKYLVRKKCYKRNILIKIVQYKEIHYVNTYVNIFSTKTIKKIMFVFFVFHEINITKFKLKYFMN